VHALPSAHKERAGVRATQFHDVPPGVVTGCLTEPACMIIRGLVSPETHYFADERTHSSGLCP
jgi:hypothetical protein